MKTFLLGLLVSITCFVYGQDKYDYIKFNRLIEIEGTEYVVATIDNWSKIEVKNKYLLFINTVNGQTKQIDLPKDSYIDKIEQVKIDSLGINKIILAAKTVNLDGNKTIDWNDPKQIIILSTDGQVKTQITDDKFFVRTWTTNKTTGTIIITGHYDTNNNGKYDKTDKNEIMIFDLKTLKMISKI
ncbi:MAG: hypothetical protein GX259_06320 [Bacteroidales bacterium]|nr:hypothetical protein [Bacteroidales bacterium]